MQFPPINTNDAFGAAREQAVIIRRISEAFCSTSALDWVLFVSAILLFCVNWWLSEIPILWKHGIVQYLDAISWQSLRVIAPGCALMCTLKHSTDPADWISLYYRGGKLGAHREARRLSIWGYLRVFSPDIFTIVVAVLAIFRVSQLELDGSTGLLHGFWFYAALPPPVIGLSLLIASLARITKRSHVAIFIGILLIIVGTAYGVIVYYFMKEGDSVDAKIGAVLYVNIILPWALLFTCCSGFWNIFVFLIQAITRIMGFGVSLEDIQSKDLLCSIKINATVAMVIIIALAQGILGCVGYYRRDGWMDFSPLPGEYSNGGPEQQEMQPQVQRQAQNTDEPQNEPPRQQTPGEVPPPFYEDAQLPSYEESQNHRRKPDENG